MVSTDSYRLAALIESSAGPSPLLDARLLRWGAQSRPGVPTASLEAADAFCQAGGTRNGLDAARRQRREHRDHHSDQRPSLLRGRPRGVARPRATGGIRPRLRFKGYPQFPLTSRIITGPSMLTATTL
jgi:hypothetical protein